MRPPEYVLGGTELRTSLYSEVRNWSTSLFTKQTLGISDFHFNSQLGSVSTIWRAQGRAGARLCAGRVVNFGTRDTTLAMPPPHQTPHLQHGHTFRVGKQLGMHMHMHMHTHSCLMVMTAFCRSFSFVFFLVPRRIPDTPPGKGHDKGVGHPCMLKSVWPDRPG